VTNRKVILMNHAMDWYPLLNTSFTLKQGCLKNLLVMEEVVKWCITRFDMMFKKN